MKIAINGENETTIYLALTMFFASRSTISSNPIAYMSIGFFSSVEDSLKSIKAVIRRNVLRAFGFVVK